MLDIESKVFSRIKNKCPQALKTKYPNINFTTSDRVPTNPKFPTVYVHEISSSELADDLQGTSINALRSTIQIEVTDNESISNAREVMNYVVNTMKTMRYRVTLMPEFQNTSSVYRVIARFRRTIGSGESI